MYASTDQMSTTYSTPTRPARPVSTRAAFGIWAAASVGGWLAVAGVLQALGVF